MIKEILKEIMKKEDEIINNLTSKAVITVDTEINGRTWRKKTEYTKNSAGEINIKDYQAIILTVGTKCIYMI